MEKLKMTPALRKLLDLAFPRYTGRKYRLEYVPTITLWDRDFSGGTHADYVILRDLGNGIERVDFPRFSPAAGPEAYSPTFPIPAGYVVVSHLMFCGHDAGITIHVNPDSRFTFLPAAVRALPVLA
jgi:hypothetical protein